MQAVAEIPKFLNSRARLHIHMQNFAKRVHSHAQRRPCGLLPEFIVMQSGGVLAVGRAPHLSHAQGRGHLL